MTSLVVLAWQRYLKQLQKQPLKTKAVTAACVAGVSDILAQYISKRPWQPSRTLVLAAFGLLWSGPSAHFWQAHLEKLFNFRKDAKVALYKVLVDQLSYGPLCNVLFMSWFTLLVERKQLRDLVLKMRNIYPGVQLQGWKVWPAASFINYFFVPLQLRVLFVNFVALFWSMYLNLQSRAANRPAAKRA